MNIYLFIASLLIFLLGTLHSVLGEWKIFIPMKSVDGLPRIFWNNELFTKRTIRFVWHVTTALAFGLGAIIYLLSTIMRLSKAEVLITQITGTVMLICFLISLLLSKGRHPSWIFFLAIGILCFMGAFQ